MNIVYLLLPFALLLGGGFLFAFIWTVKNDQYDDLETPAHRLLLEETTDERDSNKHKT